MKVGDEVRFLDAKTRTWHEGTLMALDEAAGTARVDTDDCGGVVDVALEASPLFVTREARASNTKLLPKWQPKEPAEKPAKESRESMESKEKPMAKTNKAPSANHTPEHMRALRAANLKEPVACLDCKVAFVRTAPSQKRCPECQGKRLKQMQGDWYRRKKEEKARAAGNDGKPAKAAQAPAAAPVTPAPVAPVVPAANATPPAASPAPVPESVPASPVPAKTHASAGIGTGGGWLAFAARHRQIADLAEQIAGLMAEGGAA